MTIRNSAVVKIAFVALTVAAIALVSLTNAVAETTVNNRDPIGGVTVKDGTEFLNRTGDNSSIRFRNSVPPSCGPPDR